VKGQYLIGAASGSCFVAIGARHRRVGARQNETGVAMFRDGECGAVPIQNGMAILTSVQIRKGGKLVVMRILVTVRAEGKFHLVNGVFAGRQMTLAARDGDVLAFQRIFGSVVLFDSEE
jgi:hypothetical protein